MHSEPCHHRHCLCLHVTAYSEPNLIQLPWGALDVAQLIHSSCWVGGDMRPPGLLTHLPAAGLLVMRRYTPVTRIFDISSNDLSGVAAANHATPQLLLTSQIQTVIAAPATQCHARLSVTLRWYVHTVRAHQSFTADFGVVLGCCCCTRQAHSPPG